MSGLLEGRHWTESPQSVTTTGPAASSAGAATLGEREAARGGAQHSPGWRKNWGGSTSRLRIIIMASRQYLSDLETKTTEEDPVGWSQHPGGGDGGRGWSWAVSRGNHAKRRHRERERERERGGQVHNLLLAGAAFYLSSFHRQQGSYRGRARGLS